MDVEKIVKEIKKGNLILVPVKYTLNKNIYFMNI